ncbi:MAG: urease accessory protein UreE [Rhodospirillaceae bacterium]|nr:urease accessory protein UreE [Rhodospirillaceae bacterium]
MIRATSVSPAGTWPEAELRDRIVLDYDDRFRRRKRFTAQGGLDFLLDLAEAVPLRDGDGLALETGGYVRVVAAAEKLIEVRGADAGALARLAWHLGNRHLPVSIQHERLLIRDDHVIVDMLKGLGAAVRPVEEPFDPEGGAYGQHNHDHRHPHGSVHGHDHDHDHAHGHDHGHGHHHHHD